jgi:hypothetical protein
VIIALLLTTMMISPWSGTGLPTVTGSAATYRLTISSRPDTTVHLSASGVADGWIAAFCDSHICSPTQVDERIPKSGQIVIAFELIRETDDAPHRSGAVIRGSDRSFVRVPIASR